MKSYPMFIKRSLFSLLMVLLIGSGAYAQQHTITSFAPSCSYTNETVTITGTNFTNITDVKFGGTSAQSFTVVNATTITAVVGGGASGNVTVEKTGFTVAQSAGSFTFFLFPTINEIVTDFGGFWKTNTTTPNVITPNNSHNLLSFKYGGTTYSTGVNNNVLTTNGMSYVSGNYRALPALISGNTPSPINGLYIVAASNMDGNPDVGVPSSAAVKNLTIESVLSDGVNGLNLGTGYTNLPTSVTLNFVINSIDSSRINDNEPDIIITQIADPSNTNSDAFSFKDANGNTVGQSVQVSVANIASLGTYRLDLYNVPASTPYSTASTSGISTGANFNNTSRPLRFAAFRLSDFGITSSNYQDIKKLVIVPSGISDVAFIGYNANAINLPPTVSLDPSSSSVICATGTSSAFLKVDAKASIGGALSYQWQVSTNGGTSWSDVTNTTPYSGATTDALTISTATANYKFRCIVTEVGIVTPGTGPEITITTTTGVALSGTLNPANNSTNCVGSSTPTVLSVAPTGGTGSYSYQWQSASSVNGTYTNISGEVNSTFTPPLTTAGTFYYKVVIKSGCYTNTSNSATMNVNGGDVVTSTNAATCSPGTVSLSATVSGGNIRWYPDLTSASIGNGSPFTTPSLTKDSVFYVSAVSGSCTSPRVPVKAIIASNTTLNSNNFYITSATDVVLPDSSTVSFYASSLPVGTHKIYYRVTGANTQSTTSKLVSVNANGIGSFRTAGTTNVGVNTVTIDSIDILNTSGCAKVPAPLNVMHFETTSYPLTLSTSSTATSCNVHIGTATASSTNGVSPFTYAWSGPNGYTATTSSISNLYGGSYTITVTDVNNRTGSTTVVVDSLADITAPVANVASLPNVTGECSATATAPTATDNCAGTITATTNDPLTYNAQGTYTITWTYNDGNGNTSTQTQTVIVDDVTAPVADVTTLSDVTGECSATATAPTATDNCAGTITATTNDPLTYNAQGTYTITWTYNDGNGNTSTQTQNVVVDDVTAPVADVASLSTVTGECSASVTAPTATDNCKGSITATTNDPLTYNAQGTYTITWTYDDGNGNTSTQTQTVVVDDITAPVADVASLETITDECSATVTAPTATDNCAGTITATTNDPLTYNAQGTYSITWTYDDGNGNTSTQTQTVVIDNVTAPVPDVTLLPDVLEQCSATVSNVPTATANCNGTVTGTTTDPLTYTAQGTYTITWTYEDADGNISTQYQMVVVKDTLAPVPDVATLADAKGECSVTVTPPTATDNCAGTVTATTNDPLSYSVQGKYTITWTYNDGNGNTSTQTQNVVVEDITAPVADVATLSDVTGECSASVTAPTATDNCAGSITATTNNPLTYNAQGTYTITWTYNDGNGNSSTQTQTVIVDDITAPVADVATLSDVTGECSASVTAPTATDNCAGSITATTNDPLTYNAQGTYTITWTYDDGNGNTSTQTQTVIVDDITAPVADVATLSDVTGECSASVTAPTATDNCAGSITATTNDPLTYNAQGTYTITWTYNDGNGNTSTQTQNVIVDDITAPVADVATLSDVTGECSATVAAAPTATDNCGGTITGTTNDPLTYNAQGTYTITWTYNDGNGNTSTQTQTVVVDDNTAPVADVASLPNVTGECSATATAPTATDNCAGSITATTNDPLTYNAQGTYTITWTYNDGNGNTSTQTQTVVVDDNTAPVADVASLPNVTGECSATATAPTATDNCAGSITATTNDPLTYNAQGTYTITWTYNDGNGNTSTQTQTVVVDDNTAPVADVASLPNVTGQCSATATAPTATDNCAGSITATTNDPLTYNAQGTYTITWTYNDGNGNSSTQTQNVVVDDITAPVADVASLPNVTGQCSATATAPTATDNCAGSITATTNDPLTYNAQGTYTITWTYNDGNGNTSTQTQTVIVNDNTAPTALCKNHTVALNGGSATITTANINNGSSDNCGIASTSLSKYSFGCNNIGANNVTMTVIDVNGNQSTCTSVVTVTGTAVSCSINPVPSNNVNTGGNPTKVYLGYGPQTVTLNANVTGGTATSYSWSPSTNLSCSTCANPVYAPTSASSTTYTLTVTSASGCVSTCTVTMCAIETRAWILYGYGKNNVNANKVVVCHIPPGNPGNPQIICISENAVPAHVPLHGGDNLGPCGAACGVTGTRPIDEFQGELLENEGFETIVYPNPTSGEFSIMINSESTSPITGIIYDLTGKKVMEFNDIKPNVSYPVNAPVAKGVYFLKLDQNGHQQSVRLIKD